MAMGGEMLNNEYSGTSDKGHSVFNTQYKHTSVQRTSFLAPNKDFLILECISTFCAMSFVY